MLTIAVPKGRIFTAAVELFRQAGLVTASAEDWEESRRLVIEDRESGLRLLLAKPWDVPTYVEYGAADLGLAGKDVLLERGKAVAELLDLGIGRCRMICAVPALSNITTLIDSELPFPFRVATKYPQIAATFLERQGIAAEIINLHGSVELAPIVGLADAIIDLTETGRTLQENGLRIVAGVVSVTTRLIANAVLHKVKQDEIDQMVDRLEKVVAVRAAAGG